MQLTSISVFVSFGWSLRLRIVHALGLEQSLDILGGIESFLPFDFDLPRDAPWPSVERCYHLLVGVGLRSCIAYATVVSAAVQHA